MPGISHEVQKFQGLSGNVERGDPYEDEILSRMTISELIFDISPEKEGKEWITRSR